MTAFFTFNLRGQEDFPCFPSNTHKKEKRPNIVLWITDNLGLQESELKSKTPEQRICLKQQQLFFERGYCGIPTRHKL